jgi:alpha-2-macroglobulin-like protein
MKIRLRSRTALALVLGYGSIAGLSACAAGAMPSGAAPASMAAPAPPAGAAGDAVEGMAPPPAEMAQPPAAAPPAPVQMAKAAADAPFEADEERKAEAPPQPVWAPVRQFPVPSYSGEYDGPRTDFRETIFWQPSVKTDEQGRAQVEFYLSDAITSFRGTAEGMGRGGVAGHGESLVVSKRPVSLAAKLPLEVSIGDVIQLPVTVTNATWRTYRAQLSAQFGKAFAIEGPLPSSVELKPQESRAYSFGLKVIGQGAGAEAGRVDLAVGGGSLRDSMSRTVRVVPSGFPREQALSGTLSGTVQQEIDLAEPVAGTLVASLALYPSPKATLVAGTEALLAEPTGCFEQASSANYPNVMVAGYLGSQNALTPEIAVFTQEKLDSGYKRLTGYESKGHGYEWFGEDPGHEALTAYGLMEFSDMAKVYKDLDQEMVHRTAAWLKARRDGKGGYQRNEKALDSFGKASDEVTNSYITFALTETGERDLGPEIAYEKKIATTTRDPYVLALAAGALVNVEPAGADTSKAFARLASLQAADGHFPGADHSITRSGGIALDIETAALAALAMMKSQGEQAGAVGKALEWIAKQRDGSGGFGSTQSTVLALKALTRAADGSRTPPEGTLTVRINGGPEHAIQITASMRDAIKLTGLEGELHTGKNTLEIVPALSGKDMKLPYGLKLSYRTLRPLSSGKSPVGITLTAPGKAKLGESVRVHAVIANTAPKGIPMVIARIGIPGGLTSQTWQLDELKKKGLVDFYETREREIIVYFRAMAPKAQKAFDLDLLAFVPGSYAAPASQAYLYYTDENKTFADPLTITVTP